MKIINKYKLTFNDNGFINGGYAVLDNDYDWEGQFADFNPPISFGCYKFENNEIVLDEDEKKRIEDESAKQERINELKAKLNETDYIYNSIREGGRTEEYYAEVIEQRKAWRREIQELEGDVIA